MTGPHTYACTHIKVVLHSTGFHLRTYARVVSIACGSMSMMYMYIILHPTSKLTHPCTVLTCVLSFSFISGRAVLLNKSGLARAKAGNFNLKSLNRCFSNYYQVQTRLVFAETVTYTKLVLCKNCIFLSSIVCLSTYV